LAVLEGQYPLEGAGDAWTYREYDIEVRKTEG
jgi:hypothetical protein